MLSTPFPHTRARRGGARDSERGAVIVEFAAIVAILVALIFGIIEGGLMFRAKLSLSNSTDEAVRRASLAGTAADADWQILQQIIEHSADGGGAIERVIVFRADDPADQPTQTCLDGISTTGFCNVYTQADFARPQSDFGACGPLDGNWCPTDREVDLFDGDMVGIYISGSYEPVTQVWGSITLDQKSVLPFENEGGA